MYDFNTYDNDLAYSYDDYVEEQENLGQEEYDFERYQEDMINQLIESIQEDI